MIDPTQELRGLLRQTAAGAELEPAQAQRLEQLLDAALEQAELRGIRLVVRTVTHELAQPLSEVRGYAELMLEDSFSEEQQRDCLDLIAAAARAGDLIHAISRLGRLDQPPPRRRRMAGEDLLILEPERRPPTQQSEEPPPRSGNGA